jgi:SAM-dependent methyltransferase
VAPLLSPILKSAARAVLPKGAREVIRRLGFRSLAPWYWGRRVTCPLCGGRFRRFKTFVVDPTYHNLMCPWCQSLERHRLLWLYLRHRTQILTQPLRLLHLASEYCLYQAFRSLPRLNYLTAGLDASFIQVELDLVHTPFKDDLFEMIICCHVLEHIGDDVAALRELRRVLKPGGLAFLQSPLDYRREATFEDATVVTPADRARVFGQRDHVRIYGRDYQDRLTAGGFTVTVDSYVKTLGPELISRYGLIAEDDLYIGTK